MVTVTINLKEKLKGLSDKLQKAFEPHNIERAMAVGLLPIVHDRIHVQGKASDGSQIGTYSEAYMKVRTGNYANATKFSKGKNKGKNKDSGKFTKGEKSGLLPGSPFAEARPHYNRSSDTTVVLSLTRQMENDFVADVTTDETWALGWLNKLSQDKADWAEETYKKKIFDLTIEEQKTALDIAEATVNDLLK